MRQYLNALKYVLKNGNDRIDRTKVGTRATFGLQMRFKMSDGFPAVTTKKLAFNVMKGELLWFISGSSDNKELNKLGCHIWDANGEADYWKPKAKFEGDLGRVYGVQWRDWRSSEGKHMDQLTDVIERIKTNPTDRRLIVTAWNPGELDEMVLPPCHMFYQFFVADNKLSVQMYQRSADMFLGVPFNIASYSLLLHMVAQVTNLVPYEFIHILGDAHIYKNHFDAVKEQLARKPGKLPKLWLNPKITSIYDFTMDDIKLQDYVAQSVIKAPMAV
ncbi:thymidylate synthase [Candidatus Roizmanbacteria bacterium CG09_land_8_20_14_0_10_41_9]|uniref:Thymidylate synthase n=1 Tax=Candidatus Roizmanbacteria bacterium CG09_land_8_20_14_0_10_41_9 TaxID=1974850 RepID=A0A2H0WVF5_9BACT|nr:MAG: thymidylate synthase [Candidatus Roizmanbacteria bacterium CG09_land_8_20_14_0_10_41_9]